MSIENNNTEENKPSDNLDEFLSNYSHIWKSKAALMAWIRGGIRKALWNNSPVKMNFIKKNRFKIPNPNPNPNRNSPAEVWGAKCALTGETHPITNMQVDHVIGNISLNSLDDIQSFVEHIVLSLPHQLQLVSKEAHKIKTYSERYGVSFDEAAHQKEAIQIVKDRRRALTWLKERGIIPATTKEMRREQVVEYLRELAKESNNE